MKIVLIAAFSNREIRDQLTFYGSSSLFKKIVGLFHLPPRVWEFKDCASWIPSIISEVEKQKNIELHVIGPHIRLAHSVEEFELRGVYYHFFRSDWTSFLRITKNYRIWKYLQNSGRVTKKLLNKIRPDAVILSGAENPAASVSILYADQYPRLCLCQTIYNNPERSEYHTPNRLTATLEKEIFFNLNYFGVYSGLHYRLLREFRPDATIFKYGYPSKGRLLVPDRSIEKQYDFVNFALKHGLRKGTQDSIQALAIVKQEFPKVTLNIVGGVDPKEKTEMECLVHELRLEENVFFTPFFEQKADLLHHIQKSRFAVLPCKLDHTAGTMAQSMQLGLPLVVYKTTGTPSFNKTKQCVLLAEKSNIDELAHCMLSLMKNADLAKSLSANALKYQENRVAAAKENGPRLIKIFCAMAETKIPVDLIYNPENDD